MGNGMLDPMANQRLAQSHIYLLQARCVSALAKAAIAR